MSDADDSGDGKPDDENFTHSHGIVGARERRVYASLYGTDMPFILAAGLESMDDSVVAARRFEVMLRVNFSGNVNLQSGRGTITITFSSSLLSFSPLLS